MNKNFNYIETIITAVTVNKGELKVLLIRKTDEPYKGYWILPSKVIENTETLLEATNKCLEEQTNLPANYLKQGNVFSEVDRKIDNRIIGINNICLVDMTTISLRQKDILNDEMKWFSIMSLPKIGFDHMDIIESTLVDLKEILRDKQSLIHLFPSDFSLPELQKLYEIVLGKELDRRNFRKKIMQEEIVENTGYKTEGTNGRPAKLYRFKEATVTIY